MATRNADQKTREELVSDGLMRIGETLALLGVGRSMLEQLVARGALPVVRLGRARRFPRRAVIRFMASRLETSALDKKDKKDKKGIH